MYIIWINCESGTKLAGLSLTPRISSLRNRWKVRDKNHDWDNKMEIETFNKTKNFIDQLSPFGKKKKKTFTGWTYKLSISMKEELK